MRSYTRCTLCGRTVEFKRVPMSGTYSVGVDGRLVGNYESDSAAIAAALEHVRLVENMAVRPLLPGRVRKAVRELAAVGC